MDVILKSTIGDAQAPFLSDTTNNNPDPSDPWLFTDPFARDIYVRRNCLPLLEEDIRTYAMVDGCWSSEEMEYKQEIQRLLEGKYITSIDSFGSLSPHPSVYQTLKVGCITVSGRPHVFADREYLIFEPWLARYSDPGLVGPFRVDQLYHVSNLCLNCESFPQVCICCEKTVAIMRKILTYRSNKTFRTRMTD
jgi:hypothetical protein